MKNRVALMMASVALMLAFIVVVLGAYTRLTNSGLGCPDWPGCYGHWVVPHVFSGFIEPEKAWKEMIHRYAAGTLGLLIFVLFIQGIAIRVRRMPQTFFPVGLSCALVLLLFFQAALGMWTVTWKLLPLVVMGHLMGGLSILSVLRYTQLRLMYPDKKSFAILKSPSKSYQVFLVIGLLLVIIQIALGGWVSSNYASLACVGFPTCNGMDFPAMNLHDAFNLFSPIGIDYEGGKLDSIARVTIQMVHRMNAVLTAAYVIILALWTVTVHQYKHIARMRRSAVFALLLVCIQFGLGIILVTHLLPLDMAVAHNAVAALLLLTMVSWFFYARHPQ